MKKTLSIFLAMTTITAMTYAMQNDLEQGNASINLGMWNTKADGKNFSQSGKWSFDGALTYGYKDGIEAEFRHHKLNTKNTGGDSSELNVLYRLRDNITVFGGLNHISMQDFNVSSPIGEPSRANNALQLGVISKYPLKNNMEAYARGSLGTKKTGIIEAGVDYNLDENINVNAGYRYLTTKAREGTMSYQGFMAGVSYKFGTGSHTSKNTYNNDDSYDYSDDSYDDENEPEVNETAVKKKEKPEVENTTKTTQEKDYYITSINFDENSSVLKADQKGKLDDLVKKVKSSPNKFKIIGYIKDDDDKKSTNERVRKIAQYAVDNGLDIDQFIGLSRKDGDVEKTNRIDIYEHK